MARCSWYAIGVVGLAAVFIFITTREYHFISQGMLYQLSHDWSLP